MKSRGIIYRILLIHTETRLRNFQFWAGGADRANCLTCEQLDVIEKVLEEIYPNGIDETELNDLLWFDEDIIAEWLDLWYLINIQ